MSIGCVVIVMNNVAKAPLSCQPRDTKGASGDFPPWRVIIREAAPAAMKKGDLAVALWVTGRARRRGSVYSGGDELAPADPARGEQADGKKCQRLRFGHDP